MEPGLYNTTSGPRVGGLLIDALQTIVFALAISVVIYLFFAIPNQVDGQSMQPNLDNAEVLLTNKFIQIAGSKNGLIKSYDYQRGDIVVFQEPYRPDLVKRIVGMPDDQVMIKDGKVYINGQVLVEEYLPPGRRTSAGSFLPEAAEKRIPDGYYMLLGDNRGNSKDSRDAEVGFVKREYIKGAPFIRLFPINKFGILQRGTYKFITEE